MEVDGAHNPLPTESDMLLEKKIRALVENNQIDFGAWTSLISEIEKTSPNDVHKIRMVYDSFLSEFPLCYGYWNKYARHMANLCSLNDADKVYKRAVSAAEYSVDIWVSYCTFGILAYEDPADIRRLFERALSLVGKDYLCYLLWDKYIEFEYSQKQLNRLVHVYISSLRFPTKKLYSYYESFKNLVAVWEEETGCEKNSMTPPETVSSCEITDVNACAEIFNLFRDIDQGGLGGSNTAKKYLSLGELFYQKSSQIDKKINCYEACISRPYFHVKPLDDTQLENWHKYLDFVETQGDFDWTVKLYERCLIPCANYSEFWIRYMEFVDAKGGREIANHALQRALTVFLKRVPAFHLYCSMFKEKIGDVIGALAPFHLCGIDQDPEFIGNINREANIKKRMGNTEAAHKVYEKAVEIAKTKQNSQMLCRLYSSFARFTFVVSGSIDAAIEVFVKAIQQVPCKSIIQELINFITLHGGGKLISKLDSVVTDAISTSSEVSQALNSHDREEISNLFLEFVDFYGTIHEIRKAWDRHRKLFPHIMRSYITWDTDSVNRSSMSMKVNKQNFCPSLHQTCKDSGLDGLSVHLLDSQSLKNANGMLSEGVLLDKLQEDLTDTKGRKKLVQVAEVMEEQPVPDVNEIHKAADEQAPECLDAAQILEETPEYPKIDSLIKPTPECLDVSQMPEEKLEYPKLDNQRSCPERDGGDSVPPALGKIAINSPENQTQLSNPDGSHGRNISQEAESSAGQNKHQDEANNEAVSVTHVSDQGHRNPPTHSQANVQETNSPLHSICDSTPPESGAHPQPQMQSQTNQQHALPVDVACSQSPSTTGNWAQMYYVHSSQPQQWQGHSQMQYAPAGTANQQMAVAQGYPYQSQAWTQQATQTVGQYQMGAGQVYPMGAGQVYPIGDMQQQAYAYTQSQPAAQPQTQLYQQAVQSNEQQYGYVQNGQGIPSHMWQYYQQQWYYLQQQQQQKSQQVQNNPQLEHKIEQLQPINPQQQQNQKILSQQQQQQQENQQQPSQSEQQQQNLSPLPNHSQYQQQQLSHFHQQTEQLQNAQQHPHLLYMQQQQQQLYLQQQQHLYLHQQQVLQQQQFQQLPPEQQQLLLQQQQQLLLQQQQQQMLQLQQQQQQQLQQLQQQQLQQQQQMQQTSLTELKASSDSANLQQTPVKKKSGNQKEYSEKPVSSQGEGAKIQKAEQSRSPFSTPSRATPNR